MRDGQATALKKVKPNVAADQTADQVPITRRADIPEALARVIHKALSREPEDRYPDVTALRAELKRFA